jgi:hypothetical protein
MMQALNEKINETSEQLNVMADQGAKRQGKFTLLEKKTLAFIKQFEGF